MVVNRLLSKVLIFLYHVYCAIDVGKSVDPFTTVLSGYQGHA